MNTIKRICMIFIIVIVLTGCTKSTGTITLQNAISDENNEDLKGKNPLQQALLNETTVQFYSYNTYYPDELNLSEPFYFEDISSDYYAFSMVDINFDGQKDVCLYSTIYEEQFLRVLFVEEGKVYISGIETCGCEITVEGYAVGETEKMFLVQKSILGHNNVDVLKIVSESEIYQYNGEDISLEEAESYKDKFSRAVPEKYEIIEGNILEYVK